MFSNGIKIKTIFKDWWKKFIESKSVEIPSYVLETVNKMLNCRNPDKLGFHRYSCPEHPKHNVIVPHSCKTKFCNSCGKIGTDNWVAKIIHMLPSVPFYHCVFTIPDTLRGLFEKNPFLINVLFRASADTILSWCKERHFLPIIISALHSFGKDLVFNPHIHLIATCGGLFLKDKQNKWLNNNFLPYDMLRKRWRAKFVDALKKTILLNLSSSTPSPSLLIFSNKSFFDNFFNSLFKDEFYVHKGENIQKPALPIGYVFRYAKRPPLSERKIINYNYDTVTFLYKHRNQPLSTHTISTPAFISLLIKHILPKGFHQVRHYGLLARRLKREYHKKVFLILQQVQGAIKRSNWRNRIISLTGSDPLRCPICNSLLLLSEIVFPHSKTNFLISFFPS